MIHGLLDEHPLRYHMWWRRADEICKGPFRLPLVLAELGSNMQYEQETLRRLQLVELGILRDIDRVCRAYDITYFLDSGTALGAVRHGGFIPWDDDIDIGMPRDDYERFLEVAPDALGEKYEVSDPRDNQHQAALFAKVMLKGTRFATEETIEAGFDQGVFVDVFPYDVLSADPAVEKKQRRACFFWQSVSYLRASSRIIVPHGGFLGQVERGVCGMAHAVAGLFSHKRICDSFERAALMGRSGQSGRLEAQASDNLLIMSYARTASFPRDMMLPPGFAKFEGCEFPVPARVEGYLEKLYGSTWQQLPPSEQRKNHAPQELVF